MNKRLRLSHSAVETFALCPQKYRLKNIEGVQPVDDDPKLRFGWVFHKALEAYWKHVEWVNGTSMEKAFAEWNTWATRKRLLPEEIIVGTYLLTAYDALQQKEFGQILAEQRLVVSVMGPNGLDPDLELKIIQDTYFPDQWFGMEHKTTGGDIEPGSMFWKRAKGQQLDTYFIVAEDSGQTLRFVLWDVVKVPQYRLLKTTPEEERYYKVNCKGGKKGELKKGARDHDETLAEFEERVASEILANPEAFFRQEKFYPDEPSIEKTRYDLWATGRLMLAAIREDAFPRNRQSCGAYGRRCEYAPICHEGVEPNNSQLYRISKPPHPYREV